MAKKSKKDEPLVLLSIGADGNLKVVSGMNPNGTFNTVDPTKENSDKFFEINSNGNPLENFMQKFSGQYETPSHIGLYAVALGAVDKVSAFLDKIIRVNPDDKVLDPYKVKPEGETQEQAQGKYQPLDLNKVDWKEAEKLGISGDDLRDTLKAMAYGHKSPGLVDIKTDIDGKELTVKARLSLEAQPDGSIKIQTHPYQQQPDFDKPFMGVQFTDKDIEQFQQTGNGGRVFDLEREPGGEKVPSLVSLDKMTNRFEAMAVADINIPQTLKNAPLSEEQQGKLKAGKGVLVEGMDKKVKPGEEPSKIDRIIQYNAANRNFDFRFTPEQREQHRQERQAKQEQSGEDKPLKARKVGDIWVRPIQGGVELTREQFKDVCEGKPVWVEGMQKPQPKQQEGAKQVEATEKPSVAKSIAAILGATSPKDGYLEGNGCCVTWAFGHLVGLAMPEAYGFTGFKRENLPILPKEFILVPRQVREGKEYKNDPGVMKQLKVIKELFSRADEIICCTDAGREGCLIYRYIYSYLECTKPFRRLWISSLTDRAIREGLETLRPGSDYDNLYYSARARSQADYIVGLNASQALSITAGSGVWSLGRVQTPTLAMICSRYLENKDFKPQTYFRLKVHTAKDATAFAVLSADKFVTRTIAEEVAVQVRADGAVTVTGVERKEVHQEPPLLYDLTSLQKDANKRHSFSADKTLTIAQALYEKKMISYPRTGSRYISADVLEEIPHLIAMLRAHPKFGAYIDARYDTSLNTRPVDDTKVTDHHALIITEDPAKGLSADQQLIYDMVAGRMLEAFGECCTKENTAITLDAGGVHFVAKGSIMLHPGWRNVWGATQEETADENLTVLPDLTEGDKLAVRDAEVQEKQTKPKPLHTEASLLSSMESCGREVENEKEREAMKDAGIGTPATRAAIIETLFSREYIVREKKALVPTNKGLTVYLAVRDKKIADVAMTGSWEYALSQIEKGKMDAASFHRSIEVYASQITSELLDMPFERQDNRQSCSCPKCNKGEVVIYHKVAKCNNEACGLTVWRSIAKKELSDTQITSLLMNGTTGIIKGFVSGKTGKTFEAAVKFDADFKTVFEFENKKGGKGKKGKLR